MDFRLGAQLYTVRAFTQNEPGMRESMRKVRDMGYTSVQVSGFGPVAPQAVADAALENGLDIACTHLSFDRMQQDLDAVIAEHKLWNCQYAGVGMMPERYRENAAGYAQFAKEASLVAQEMGKEGIKLIYHNHMMEFMRLDGKLGMDILFDESDPALQFELDTYWVQCGGADPVAWIWRMNGRMDVVHFKDFKVTSIRDRIMCEIGEGNLSWPAIVTACQETAVRWAMVEQDVCDGDPFDSLQISLNYLRGLGLS